MIYVCDLGPEMSIPGSELPKHKDSPMRQVQIIRPSECSDVQPCHRCGAANCYHLLATTTQRQRLAHPRLLLALFLSHRLRVCANRRTRIAWSFAKHLLKWDNILSAIIRLPLPLPSPSPESNLAETDFRSFERPIPPWSREITFLRALSWFVVLYALLATGLLTLDIVAGFAIYTEAHYISWRTDRRRI